MSAPTTSVLVALAFGAGAYIGLYRSEATFWRTDRLLETGLAWLATAALAPVWVVTRVIFWPLRLLFIIRAALATSARVEPPASVCGWPDCSCTTAHCPDAPAGARDILAAEAAEPSAWTIIGPNGERFTGESPLRAASAAARHRVKTDPVAAKHFHDAIASLQAENDAENERLMALHGTLNCPTCGGSGHIGDVKDVDAARAAQAGSGQAVNAESIVRDVAGEMDCYDFRDVVACVRAALTTEPAQAEPQGAELGARELLHEVFALCEATEDIKPERAFDDGRRFEAKSIRRAIGTWFQDETRARALRGERHE